jgi:hypothetical protein
MEYPKLKLCVLDGNYAVCRLPGKAHIPEWVANESLVSITRSEKELTIVCDKKLIPDDCEKSRDWKCIKIVGSFDLDAVGVMASVSVPLAENQISIYVVSTFDTDYFLVPAKELEKAALVLKDFSHEFPDSKEMS